MNHIEDSAEKPHAWRWSQPGILVAALQRTPATSSIVQRARWRSTLSRTPIRRSSIRARELGVLRNWHDRWHPDLGALEEALRLSDADVVHFQFNFGFFELSRLAQLIERELESRGVVVTFHRTKDATIDGEVVSLSSIKPTLERVDRLIVHQVEDLVLAGMGLSENVSVVPLGASAPPAISFAEARTALGLGDTTSRWDVWIPLPHKGTLELVQAVGRLRDEFPDICLLALCAHYPDVTSDEYEADVRAEIDHLGLGDNVVLMSEYLPDETVTHHFADGRRDRPALRRDGGIFQRSPPVSAPTRATPRHHRPPRLCRLPGMDSRGGPGRPAGNSKMHSGVSSSIPSCATPWRPGQGTGPDDSAGPASSLITRRSTWLLADPVENAERARPRCESWGGLRKASPPSAGRIVLTSPRPMWVTCGRSPHTHPEGPTVEFELAGPIGKKTLASEKPAARQSMTATSGKIGTRRVGSVQNDLKARTEWGFAASSMKTPPDCSALWASWWKRTRCSYSRWSTSWAENMAPIDFLLLVKIR